jgi:pilus assembly protein TadC
MERNPIMSTTKTIEARHTDEELDAYVENMEALLAIKREREELSREWDEIQSDKRRQPMTLETVEKMSLAAQRLLEIQQKSIKLDARESELTKANAASGVDIYAQDLIQRGQEILELRKRPFRRLFESLRLIALMWVAPIVYYMLQASRTNQYLDIFISRAFVDMFTLGVFFSTLFFLLTGIVNIAIAQRKNRELSSSISSRDILFLTRLDRSLGLLLLKSHEYVPEDDAGR